MALEKQYVLSKVDCVADNYHILEIREKTIVLEDDKVISEKFHRRTLVPGTKDEETGNYVKTDTSLEGHLPITAMIENCWTGSNDQAYAAHIGATWIDE